MTTTPKQILLIEDNPGDARLVTLLLAEIEPGIEADRFSVVCVTRIEEAKRLLQARRFDAALVDLGLPDSTGLQTLHAILQAAPSLPVVILSGLGDEAVSIEAVKAGAQDYLVKGTADSRLIINAIRYAIERKQRARTLEAIADFTREMRNAWTVHEISEHIVDRLGKLFGVADSVAVLVEPESGELKISAARGRFVQAVGATFAGRVGYTGELLQAGVGLVTTISRHDPKSAFPDLIDSPLEAAGAPLIVDGTAIGVLWLFRNHILGESVTFKSDDQTVLMAVADIAASAIKRARLSSATLSQKEQLQTVVDTVADGLVLLDGHHRILLANNVAQRHLARLATTDAAGTIVDLGGMPIEQILHTAQAQEPHELQVTAEAQMIYEVHAYPLTSASAAGEWLLSLRDVTDERRRGVRRLQQARMAAVGQMAAGIAHEFSNSLASILLYGDLLGRNPNISQDDQRRLQIILREAQQTADLVHQLLDFSHQALEVESHFDLVPFVSRLLDIWTYTLPETIVVAFECSDEVKLVRADPTRLQQALMNLVAFAEKSMPAGGALWLSVGSQTITDGDLLLPEMTPGHFAVITLRHSGTPIPESALPHIFEPYYIGDDGAQSTRLRLAQVYGIIAQHNGAIRVTSAEGGDTGFTIYLPIAEEGVASDPKPPLVAPPPYSTTLIVLSSAVLLRRLQAGLSGHRRRVLTSSSGLDALRRYSVDLASVDLVITTPTLSDIAGDELWGVLREIAPKARVIFLTDDPAAVAVRARDTVAAGQASWQQLPLEGPNFNAALTNLVNQILRTFTPR